jgi:hypothetical protein
MNRINKVPIACSALVLLAITARLAFALGFSDESQLPHRGFLRTPFSLQLKARAGSPPYTFRMNSGHLPPGLELSKEGLITGTPTELGTFKFWGELLDKTGRGSQRQITITIVDPATTRATTKPTTHPTTQAARP